MSILLRDTRTGIITSTDLFGDTLGLYLRENPDIVRVGLGTTANSDYYVLLNSNDIESTQPNVSNNLKFNPYTGSLSGISSISGTIGYASSAGIATYATSSGIATYASSAGIATYATSSGIATYASSAGIATYVITNANLTGDITSSGNVTAIAAGVIVDADINASAGIVDTKLATISTAGKVSNSATTATNANTASTIVARDASGNFSAGTITATSFSGNGANLTGIDATRIVNGNSNITVNSNNTITTTANSATINTVSSTGVAMASGKRLDISSFTETVQTLGSSGSAISGSNALDVGTYSTFIAYVGTSAVTFTLTGGVNGRLSSWTLILIYTNSGTRSITFSFGTLRYPGGSSSITLSNTQVHDVVSFFTADNATNTYASIIGLGFAT